MLMKRIFKKMKLVNFAAGLFLALGFVFAFQMNAAAATAAPAGLTQVGAGETSVEISWEKVFGSKLYYYWRISDSSNFANCSYDWESSQYSGCKALINGLKAGRTYYVQVGTSSTSASTLAISGAPADTAWSSPVSVVTRPEKVDSNTIQYTNATETSISLNWADVSGATSYKVDYWIASSSNANTVYTNTASVTINGLEKNTKYSVYIYSIRQNEGFTAVHSSSGAKYNMPTLPTKITGLDCTYFNPSVKSVRASFEWDPNSVADGYQYEIYKYNGKKKLLSGTSGYKQTSISNSKLKTRQIYKIRVRGYVNTANNQKKYGAWSAYEYFSRCTGTDTHLKKSGSKIKASWKKVTGASNYTIYLSTKNNGKYKKMGTTKKTSYTINTKLKKGNYYYVRVVPDYKSGKKTYPATVNSRTQYSAYAYYNTNGRFYSWN